MPVDTNILIYDIATNAKAHAAHLEAQGIRCFAIGPKQVRMVTHLDIDDAAIDRTVAALNTIPE